MNKYVFSNTASGLTTRVGILPQIITDALPIIRALGYNGSAYIGNSIKGFGLAGATLSSGVWNAAGDVLSLNIPAAITTLTNAINLAGNLALGTGQYVLQGVITRVTALATALGGSLNLLLTNTIAQAQTVLASVTTVANNIIAGISALNPQATWNAAVVGLLGPAGIPGTLLGLTIGQNVGGALSVRTEISGLVQTVAGALNTPIAAPPFPPVAAVPPKTAAVKSVAASAAAAKAVAPSTAAKKAAPAASATAGDNNGGSKSAAKSSSSNGGSEGGSAHNSNH